MEEKRPNATEAEEEELREQEGEEPRKPSGVILLNSFNRIYFVLSIKILQLAAFLFETSSHCHRRVG